MDYYIEFDDPQADFTDEMYGDYHRRYRGTTASEQFLRQVDVTQPPTISHRSL
jgi:hypothetical protein